MAKENRDQAVVVVLRYATKKEAEDMTKGCISVKNKKAHKGRMFIAQCPQNQIGKYLQESHGKYIE